MGLLGFFRGRAPVAFPLKMDSRGVNFPDRDLSGHSIFPANRDFLISPRDTPILGRLPTEDHFGALSVGVIVITTLRGQGRTTIDNRGRL